MDKDYVAFEPRVKCVECGDVVEFVHLLSVRFLSLSAETLNRLGHG